MLTTVSTHAPADTRRRTIERLTAQLPPHVDPYTLWTEWTAHTRTKIDALSIGESARGDLWTLVTRLCPPTGPPAGKKRRRSDVSPDNIPETISTGVRRIVRSMDPADVASVLYRLSGGSFGGVRIGLGRLTPHERRELGWVLRHLPPHLMGRRAVGSDRPDDAAEREWLRALGVVGPPGAVRVASAPAVHRTANVRRYGDPTPSDAEPVFRALYYAAPLDTSVGLREQWNRDHPNMVAFLKELGLAPIPVGTSINANRDVYLTGRSGWCAPEREYKPFRLSGADINRLMNDAIVTYNPDLLPGGVQRALLLGNADAIPSDRVLENHAVAVSGPVRLLSDNGTPRPIDGPLLWCVSIAGINFSYSAAEKAAFSGDGRVNDAGRARMREIWHHVLSAYELHGVTHAVLNAIGCGAFKGNVADVPNAWADTLYDVLSGADYGLRAVCVCLPPFNDDNFERFAAVFDGYAIDRKRPLATKVFLTRTHGMMGLADYIARHNADARVGILNPSDPVAVRKGAMGMYWNGYHIALEELMAVQTTLLLQHVNVNPVLWGKVPTAIGTLRRR